MSMKTGNSPSSLVSLWSSFLHLRLTHEELVDSNSCSSGSTKSTFQDLLSLLDQFVSYSALLVTLQVF